MSAATESASLQSQVTSPRGDTACGCGVRCRLPPSLMAVHTRSRIPAAWWITALNIALVMLYTIVLPTYRAPDEPEHFDLVRYVATARDYPAFDGLALNEQTVASLKTTKLGRTHLGTTDIAARGARNTFDELAPDMPSDRPNRMPQHPPAYYGLMGLVYGILSLVGLERAPYDVVVMVTRASNVIFAAAIPLLAYVTALRLSRHKVASVAAAAVPLAIPQLIHIQGSVNNDNLWILLASLTTYFVARVLRGDTTSRTALVLGLLVGLSLFTKAFALVMPLWILVLYLIVWRRGTRFGVVATRLAQAGAVAFVAGGWWWFRNLIVYGRIQASVPIYRDTEAIDPDVIFWLKTFVTWLTESFWGWMGFFEAKLPVIVIAGATLIVVITLILAIIPTRRWQRPISPGEVIFLLLPALLIVPIVVVRAYSVYVNTGITAGIQGRYLFPSVTALAAVMATTWLATGSRVGRFVPSLTLGWVGIMQIAGVASAIGVFYGAADSTWSEKIRVWLHWSPVAAPISLLLLVGVAVLFGIAVVVTLSKETDRLAGEPTSSSAE